MQFIQTLFTCSLQARFLKKISDNFNLKRIYCLAGLLLCYGMLMTPAEAQNLIWAAQTPASTTPQGGPDQGWGVTARDAQGNVYVTGHFENTSDFDPGPGTANLTSTGGFDVFVAKYDPNGAYLWAINVGGTSYDYGYGIAIDGSGDVLVTGTFYGYSTNPADFDPGSGTANLTSNGYTDIFVAKYSGVDGSYQWAINMGGYYDDYGYGVDVDASGNVFVTGYFYGYGSNLADFDPGTGTANLTSNGNYDIFVAKYSGTNGAYQWALNVGGANYDYGYDIAIDGSGDVLVTGQFYGYGTNTVDFDPGSGTANLTSNGSHDIFVAKYSGASGAYQWAINMGGNSTDVGYGIDVDASGDVLITGYFYGYYYYGTYLADFDPGPGTANLSNNGQYDIFVAKYSGTNGAYQWAKNIGGTSSEYAYDIAVDGSGDAVITGYFYGYGTNTVDFDPGTGTANLTSNGGNDIFVAKYSGIDGSYEWANAMGGNSNDVGRGIAVDPTGDVLVTGHFYGTADFDPGSGTATLGSTTNYTDETFVAKYSGSTGAYLWADQIGIYGNSYEYVRNEAVETDAAGNSYITGRFQGTADFDPGPGTATMTSVGGYDCFIAKYSPSGAYLWAISLGGISSEEGWDLAIDGSGDILVTGRFYYTVDFDPGPGTANLTSTGSYDIFVAKYSGTDGSYQWAVNIGGTNSEYSHAIDVDASGDVVITGYFYGAVDFDPGLGSAVLTSAYYYYYYYYYYNYYSADIFVAKYSGTNGAYQWAKKMGGSSYEYGYDVAFDGSGDVLVTGAFQNTVDFDPGSGTANLSSNGSNDIFLAKYSGANGNYLWASNMGGSSNDYGRALAVDGSGDVLVTGRFYSTADFNPGSGTANLTSSGSGDVFVGKYSGANGAYQWAIGMGGTSYDEGWDIAADGVGDVVVTGRFYTYGTQTADFDPGPGTADLTSAGSSDIFVAKYSGVNGAYQSAFSVGGPNYEYAGDLALDGSGNILIAGYFYRTVDLEPGPGTTTLTSVNNEDGFLAKYGNCVGQTYYQDNDQDGYGNPAITQTGCSGAPAGFVANADDCDDTNSAINPTTTWYLDADNDNYYTGSGITQCTSPGPGYRYTGLAGGGDCNDGVSGINPGAAEITCNGIDENCNGMTDDDPLPPNAVCQDVTVQLDANGNGSTTAGAVDNGSNDACGIAGLALSQTSFDCNHVGNNSVTLTVTDNSNQTADCAATVTVEDNVAPNALCQDVTVQLDANGSGVTTANDVDNGSNDACGVTGLSLSQTSFSCTHVGANTVSLEVTDSNGNTSDCDATVTVEDNVAPNALCQDVTVQLDASGSGSIAATDVDNGSNDACGVAGLSVSQATFACGQVGANTVTLVVTDNNGNTSDCDATVTVEDNVAPNALCQDVTVQLDASGSGSIAASDVDNGSNDACGVAGLSVSQATFACGQVGANTVTLLVTDNNGNTSDCDATVTVEDNVAPNALCQDVTVQLDGNGSGSTTANDVDNGSNDACGVAGLSLSQTGFDCSHIGPNTVTLTVTDNNGNTSDCGATVTVEDNVAPNALCKALTIYLEPTGTIYLAASSVDNGSNDNCDNNPALTVSPNNFGTGDVGNNTVTLTVTDIYGNAASCNAVVHVSKRITAVAYTGQLSGQYSDWADFEAVLTDVTPDAFGGGTAINDKPIDFSLNNQLDVTGVTNHSCTPNANGYACATDRIDPGPGTYQVQAVYDGNSIYRTSSDTKNFIVNPEDATTTYTGVFFASTSSINSSTATVALSATIYDITAVASDPAHDADPGDIRKATVTFYDRSNPGSPVAISSPIPVVLVNPNDSTVGTVSFLWTVNIGNSESDNFVIGVKVEDHYSQFDADEDVVVTVSKPLPNFVTGGGYKILTNSSGTYAGDVGSKNNFGLSAKFNKKGKKIQGRFTAIIRRVESDGIKHIYQVKSNATNSLSFNATADKSAFTGKANLTDVTDPNNPISLGGNLDLQVNLSDLSGAGLSDSINIVLKNSSGTYLFVSSMVNGVPREQALDGGNLVIHSGNSSSRLSQSSTNNSLIGYPNPVSSVLNVKFDSEMARKIDIQLFDMKGSMVYQMAEDAQEGNNPYKLDLSGLAQGAYMLRVIDLNTGEEMGNLLLEKL